MTSSPIGSFGVRYCTPVIRQDSFLETCANHKTQYFLCFSAFFFFPTASYFYNQHVVDRVSHPQSVIIPWVVLIIGMACLSFYLQMYRYHSRLLKVIDLQIQVHTVEKVGGVSLLFGEFSAYNSVKKNKPFLEQRKNLCSVLFGPQFPKCLHHLDATKKIQSLIKQILKDAEVRKVIACYRYTILITTVLFCLSNTIFFFSPQKSRIFLPIVLSCAYSCGLFSLVFFIVNDCYFSSLNNRILAIKNGQKTGNVELIYE